MTKLIKDHTIQKFKKMAGQNKFKTLLLNDAYINKNTRKQKWKFLICVLLRNAALPNFLDTITLSQSGGGGGGQIMPLTFVVEKQYYYSFKDLYWKPCNYEEAYHYDFPLHKKGWHEIYMSINSFMILTYCLSDLINLIRFQFYYRPRRLMMARVIVLFACIFILSKSKLLLVAGRNFIKIQFFMAFRLFLWSSVNMLFELAAIVGF